MTTGIAIWVLTATGMASAIAFDMNRLSVNQVWLSRVEWALVCSCMGPIAGLPYLIFRRAVWRTLVASVWQIVGDSSESTPVRRRRLLTLRCNGLIGAPVFHACLKTLDAGYFPSSKYL